MRKKTLCLATNKLSSESSTRNTQYSHRLNDDSFAQQLPDGRHALIKLERKRSKHRLQTQNLDLELKLIADIKDNIKNTKKLVKEKATIAEWAFDDIDKPVTKKKKKDDVDTAVSDEISADNSEESETSDDLDSLLNSDEQPETTEPDSKEFEDV